VAAADFSEALQDLAKRLRGADATIERLIRLSGGASQETWAFDCIASGTLSPMILRRAPGGIAPARSSEAISLQTEAALIQIAEHTKAPVPSIVHVCQPEDGLGEAFIMGRIEGETLARKILRDPEFDAIRPQLARNCGTILAQIHSAPLANLPNLPHSDGAAQLARYQTVYRDFGAKRPVFELAFAWLAAHVPKPLPPTLVHGDFRNGNLIIAPDGVKAVLDWELSHIGDPREDLGWICVASWRFGQLHNTVGGFGTVDDLIAGYQEAGGIAVTAQDIKWFEMMGTLKWGVMCLIMYQAFASGLDPSVEKAAIGRRASETEIDLMNIFASLPHA